jgi:hypothetical protein
MLEYPAVLDRNYMQIHHTSPIPPRQEPLGGGRMPIGKDTNRRDAENAEKSKENRFTTESTEDTENNF